MGVLEDVCGPAGDRPYLDTDATLDDLREAVTTLEETEQTARRVLGGAHPTTASIQGILGESRNVLARAITVALGDS